MFRASFVYLCLSLYTLGIISPNSAWASPVPANYQETFSAASPSEMGRKITRAFEDLKAGLNPVLIVVLYIAIAFGALIAFAVLVMFLFFLIMVLRRH